MSRGCSKVGSKALAAAAKYCPLLTVVNLSYTSVTPASLVPLIVACPHLEVLKLAGIPNWASAHYTYSATTEFKQMMDSDRFNFCKISCGRRSAKGFQTSKSPHFKASPNFPI
jgi:hypothetical protein